MEEVLDVYDKIAEGYYQTELLYPGPSPKKPKPIIGDEYKEINEAAVKIYEQKLKEYKEARIKYNNDVSTKNAQFKVDALNEVGLFNHPRADRIFDYAWNKGHSGGLREVLLELEDLANLFLE